MFASFLCLSLMSHPRSWHNYELSRIGGHDWETFAPFLYLSLMPHSRSWHNYGLGGIGKYLLHFSVCLSCPTPRAFACCSKSSLVSGESSSEFQWQELPGALLLLTFPATSSPARSPYLERIFIFAVTKHSCACWKGTGAVLPYLTQHKTTSALLPCPLHPVCEFRIQPCPSCFQHWCVPAALLPWPGVPVLEMIPNTQPRDW